MKRITLTVLLCFVLISFAYCLGSSDNQNSESSSIQLSNLAEDPDTHVLVAYFAYAENIGDTSGMSVDAIASASIGRTSNREGNIPVMADVLREEFGADVFSISVEDPYEPVYDDMHDRAIEEIRNESLPELATLPEDIEEYDVVFIGTPVWGGTLPRPVASFLSSASFSGKTIIPFGINLGSGFGNIVRAIRDICPDSEVMDGFTINARTANDEVREEFAEWLSDRGLV